MRPVMAFAALGFGEWPSVPPLPCGRRWQRAAVAGRRGIGLLQWSIPSVRPGHVSNART